MNPFEHLPLVPSFEVTSQSLAATDWLPIKHFSSLFGIPGGEDISPELTWSGAPEQTKSFAVSVYDPDAPTGAGFWHWTVINIPADTNHLEENAGSPDGSLLPAGAIQLPNDARAPQYVGAAPLAGDEPHNYYIVVQALDVAQLDISADATPTFARFNMLGHELSRGVLHVKGQLK